MVSTINTNSSSAATAYHLTKAHSALSRSMARLSSGSKLVETSDDSGGAAVFFKTNSAVIRRDAVLNNLGNAMSWLQSQSASLNAIGAQLSRMSELFVLMRDVTKSSEDRDNYWTEFEGLRREMGETMSDNFNGKDLLDLDGNKDPLTLYLDESGAKTITLELTSFSSLDGNTPIWSTLLGDAPDFNGRGGISRTFDELSAEDEFARSQGSEGIFAEMFEKLAGSLAANGAMQSRINFATDSVRAQKIAFEQAASRIGDTDVAVEVARLARSSILVESSSAMLAQANSTGRVLLRIMEG